MNHKCNTCTRKLENCDASSITTHRVCTAINLTQYYMEYGIAGNVRGRNACELAK